MNNHNDLPLCPDDDKDNPHIGELVNFEGLEYYLYGVDTLAEARGYQRIRLGRHNLAPDRNSFEVRTDKLDLPIIERGSRNRKTPVRINPSPSVWPVLPAGNTHTSSNITNPHLKKSSLKKGKKSHNKSNSRRQSISFGSPVPLMNMAVTPGMATTVQKKRTVTRAPLSEDEDEYDEEEHEEEDEEEDEDEDKDEDKDEDERNERNRLETQSSAFLKRKLSYIVSLQESLKNNCIELQKGFVGTLHQYTSDDGDAVNGLVTNYDEKHDVLRIIFIGYKLFSSFKLNTRGTLGPVDRLLDEEVYQQEDPQLLYGVGVRRIAKDGVLRNGMIVYYNIKAKQYYFVLVGEKEHYCMKENSSLVKKYTKEYSTWCKNNNINAEKIGDEKCVYESNPYVVAVSNYDMENDKEEKDLESIESGHKKKRNKQCYKPRKPLAKTSYKINQIKQFEGTFDITKYDEKLLDGVVFCFTGNIDDDKDSSDVLTRLSLEDNVKKLGGRIINKLSGTVNYLVCGGRLSNYGGGANANSIDRKKQSWNYRRGKTYIFAQDELVQHGLVIVEGKDLFYALLNKYQLEKDGTEVSDESASDSDSDSDDAADEATDITQPMLFDMDLVDVGTDPIQPLISFEYEIDEDSGITKDSSENEIEPYIYVNSYYICPRSKELKVKIYHISEWRTTNQIHQAIFLDNEEKPNKSKKDVKMDLLLIEEFTEYIANFKDQPKIVKGIIVKHIMKRSMHARFTKLKQRFISLDECRRLSQQEDST